MTKTEWNNILIILLLFTSLHLGIIISCTVHRISSYHWRSLWKLSLHFTQSINDFIDESSVLVSQKLIIIGDTNQNKTRSIESVIDSPTLSPTYKYCVYLYFPYLCSHPYYYKTLVDWQTSISLLQVFCILMSKIPKMFPLSYVSLKCIQVPNLGLFVDASTA